VAEVRGQDCDEHVGCECRAHERGGEAGDQQPAAECLGDRHERRHQGRRRDPERVEELLGRGQVAQLVDAVQEERDADDDPQQEQAGAG